MSKYRIVKHQAGEIIRYCPEVWEYTFSIGGVKESWRRLAGNKNLTSLDLWVWSLPETIEEAKSIIEKHIEDQKPKYSEEVVYEYDTEKKEQQKKLLTEIMETDQKNGMYEDHIGDTNKMVTAVEWFIDAITESGHLWMTDKPNDMLELAKFIEQAKQMEKEQIMKSFKSARIPYKYDADLRLNGFEDAEHYYNETYGKE